MRSSSQIQRVSRVGYMAGYGFWVVGILGVIALVCAFCSTARSEETQAEVSKPIPTKLDHIWTVSKWCGYPAAVVDAYTTSRGISRGYVESGRLDNVLIPRDRPMLAARSGLLVAEAWGINTVLGYAYKKCGKDKLCKVVVIGARGYFTGMSIRNSIHNMGMK